MSTSAGAALLAYLRVQHNELLRHAPGVLDGLQESIHQARVASRRLRSLLATARPLFGAGEVQDVRHELRWLSGELGAARDPWVAKASIAELLAAEPGNLAPGPAAALIEAELESLTAAGLVRARTALEGERYTRLLAGLARLLADPPFTAKAAGKPSRTLRKLISRDESRLKRAVGALPRPTVLPPDQESAGSPAGLTASSAASSAARFAVGPAARDVGLHEVRKAAKRLRYAAEFAVVHHTGVGKSHGRRIRQAKRTAAAARRIQAVLGEHQDSVVARALLCDLTVARGDGRAGFTLGRLHAREEQRAFRAEKEFIKTWKKFLKTR